MTEELGLFLRKGESWRGLDRVLRKLEQPSRRRNRIPVEDVALANRDMHVLGCSTRYRPDGTPFMLAPGDQDPARPS
jgi:hypothetical protein